MKERVFLKWVENSIMHADGNDYCEWSIDNVREKRGGFWYILRERGPLLITWKVHLG